MITKNIIKIELVQKLVDEKKISAIEAAILLEEQEGQLYPWVVPYTYPQPFQWQPIETTCLTIAN